MLHPYAFAGDPFQVRVWFAVPRFYVKGLRVFHATAELNKKYMKTKILSLLVVLMSTWSGNVALAQFTSDKVLIYVKADIEPSKALNGQAIVIGYFSDEDEIRNMSTDANSIRKTISSHPSYFKSPYNLPDYCSDLSIGYIAPQWCQYNSTASTSKYRVYSGHERSGRNAWGQYSEGGTKNWAFSKDGKKLIFWISGKEDNRTIYLLTGLSEFDPSTSSSSNYDFLE